MDLSMWRREVHERRVLVKLPPKSGRKGGRHQGFHRGLSFLASRHTVGYEHVKVGAVQALLSHCFFLKLTSFTRGV